jgi:hypothetical protein
LYCDIHSGNIFLRWPEKQGMPDFHLSDLGSSGSYVVDELDSYQSQILGIHSALHGLDEFNSRNGGFDGYSFEPDESDGLGDSYFEEKPEETDSQCINRLGSSSLTSDDSGYPDFETIKPTRRSLAKKALKCVSTFPEEADKSFGLWNIAEAGSRQSCNFRCPRDSYEGLPIEVHTAFSS